MKLRSSLIMLLCAMFLVTNAQDYSTMRGSAYCAMKKARSQKVSHQPFNSTSGPKHKFDVIKYNLDLDLYDCYIAPYPRSFSGSAIITIR